MYHMRQTNTGLSCSRVVVALTDKHVAVGRVGDGKQVRRHLRTTLSLVPVDDVRRVDGQTTVRVDDDTEQTGVCLQQPRFKHETLPYSTCC